MRKLDRVVYRTRKEHLYHPDLGAYNSYGIAIFVKYNHKTLDYISDVDVSRQRAKKSPRSSTGSPFILMMSGT